MSAAESRGPRRGVSDAAWEIALALGSGQDASEVGAWSLSYLGPGFGVQVRIARRDRKPGIEGWVSPVRPITVILTSVARAPVVLETTPTAAGRFEFVNPPTGACRLVFLLDDTDRPFTTPPFWI